MGQTYTKWSDAELFILREKAGKVSAAEIGKEVGRGTEGVKKMIGKLGLQGYGPVAKPRTPATPKPPREAKIKEPKPPVLRKPLPVKKATFKRPKVLGTVEWCPNCHAPVSNWGAHLERMAYMGCKRPAA
jgi:hypothetical protein